jgi:hypothetical protein
MAGLVTAPEAILFGVIPLFKGHHFEACVPQGSTATNHCSIGANPLNTVLRSLSQSPAIFRDPSQLCWVGYVAIRAGRATPTCGPTIRG